MGNIELHINGQKYFGKEGETILNVAKNNGIEIPALCSKEKTKPLASCNLCKVRVEGEKQLKKACETEISSGMEIITSSKEITAARKKALEVILSNHYADCEAPCKTACPDHVDIQAYLAYIAQGEHQLAIKVIKETLPMPLSIGRVCPAFCENECRRTIVEEPVAIKQLKRHAADFDLHLDNPYIPEKKDASGKKIAIVGAGPSGLTCGYYLSNNGHDVTVFESAPKAGGWLRYGIPEYRLPKDILDKEIDLMCANGMKIETNVEIGKTKNLADLSKNYDAVYLAIGAQLPAPMRLKNDDLEGCYLGVDFLKDLAMGKEANLGKKVAIIGAGNTAIDCARTSRRLGSDVTLVYRRTRKEMPAEDFEITAAEEEGVKFHLLTNPVENIGINGKLNEIKFEKMKLGEPDESGRRKPIPTGSFFTEQFDSVIGAISQKVDSKFLKTNDNNINGKQIPLSKWDTVIVDESTMYVGFENVFAGGDFRLGPATAIEAIADGRIASESIEKYFEGKLLTKQKNIFNSMKAKKLEDVDPKEYQEYQKKARAIMPELDAEIRATNFEEVETGYDEQIARDEADRCLSCGCYVNTSCGLRDYSTEYDAEQDLSKGNGEKHSLDYSTEFIVFDRNKCIECGLCVAGCNHTVVHEVINWNNLEHKTHIMFDEKSLMGDSSCVQCGECVQLCPVGALLDSRAIGKGRTQELKMVESVCPYCGVGCRVELYVNTNTNEVVRIEGVEDSITNEGMLCLKGRYGFDYLKSQERLTTPLIKENGEFRKASWDEALKLIASKLNKIKEDFGPDAIAGFTSARVTNEDNYVFQKLLRREIGTNSVDHCARLCHSSTVAGLARAFGSGAMTNDIPGIKKADVIFIIGSDTSAAHPVIAARIKQAVREGKSKLIVVDPKKIEIADYAEIYSAHRPGSDVAVLNSIMQVILKNAWEDKEYIRTRTEDFEELKKEVLKDKYSPENVEKISGVPANEIEKIAEIIGTAKVTSVYYAMGITQHTTGVDNVWTVANLQMLCGNVGIEGGGVNPLRGQSNVQGACDVGGLPNVYPGYQRVDDPIIREKFEKFWNKKLNPEKGLYLPEMIEGVYNKTVKALYIMGENPYLSDPDQTHVIEAFENTDFMIVQDIFLSETAEMADVVLPAAAAPEEEGHFTNTERRIQRLRKAVNPPGEAKADWEIIQLIANAMGSDWNYSSAKDIFEEINLVTPQYAGISWDRVGRDGLQWPCPTEDHPGTPYLHKETFARGKGKFKAISFKEPAELTDEEYPLIMTTGRLLEHYHTGTMTRKTKGLNNLAGPRVMISVQDAEELNISNSEMVSISTRRGEITAPAFVTKRIQKGVIFIPFHFAESPVNRLTNPEVDKIARIPELKVAAAKIKKL